MRARFAPAPAVLLLPVSLLLASAGDARAQEPEDRVQALLRELVGEEASRKLRYVPVPSAAPEGAASRAGAAPSFADTIGAVPCSGQSIASVASFQRTARSYSATQ